MKNTTFIYVLAVCFAFIPSFAFAHQPKLVESRETYISAPEISKAYYGKLTGEPDVYIIEAPEAFDLYVNILVPDIPEQKKDVSVVISKRIPEGQGTAGSAQVAVLEGVNFEWKKFYEPFGADTYWMGPEYKAKAEPGIYEIRVWSSNNDSKYSLAVGEIEAFDMKETLNTLSIIPKLKATFFDKSPAQFIFSPFGWGSIVILYLLAGIVGFIYRFTMLRFASSSSRQTSRNIGTQDRVVRFLIGIALLMWAITTSWNLFLIFLSGFAIFEALFSWCGLYALLGKNTCPAN